MPSEITDKHAHRSHRRSIVRKIFDIKRKRFVIMKIISPKFTGLCIANPFFIPSVMNNDIIGTKINNVKQKIYNRMLFHMAGKVYGPPSLSPSGFFLALKV